MEGNQWKFIWWVGESRGKNALDGRIAEMKGLRQERADTKDAGPPVVEGLGQKQGEKLARCRALRAGCARVALMVLRMGDSCELQRPWHGSFRS